MRHYFLFTVLAIMVAVTACKKSDSTPAVPITAPAAPGNLIAVLSNNNTAILTWADSSNNETGFKIERKVGNGSYQLFDSVKTSVITYTDSTLQPNATYYYRVFSYNSVGKSTYTNEVSVKTIDTTPYSPFTLGSSWKYLINSSDSVYKDSVYLLTMTDSMQMIGNKNFHVLNSNFGGDAYYALTDSGYFRRGSLLASLGIPELTTFEEKYLSKKPAINDNWTIPLTINSSTLGILNLTLKYTVQAMPSGTSFTIPIIGTTYNDVMSVHLTIPYPGQPFQIGYGDFYYSKSAGLIYLTMTTLKSFSSQVTTTFALKSFKNK